MPVGAAVPRRLPAINQRSAIPAKTIRSRRTTEPWTQQLMTVRPLPDRPGDHSRRPVLRGESSDEDGSRESAASTPAWRWKERASLGVNWRRSRDIFVGAASAASGWTAACAAYHRRYALTKGADVSPWANTLRVTVTVTTANSMSA